MLPVLVFTLSLPPVEAADLHRFPPQSVVKQQRLFAQMHIAWLGRVQAQNWQIAEAERLYYVWDKLDDCHIWATERDKKWLRHNLATLRRLLGPADYFAGRMPPPVPLEYFLRP